MPRDYNSIIGSGCTPNVAHSTPYNLPDGLYPIPDQRHSLRNRQGEGVVVLNPENFSVSIGLLNQAISVPGGTGIALPLSPLENRRALVIHNFGPGILYIGLSTVSTSNGFPILVNEKIAIDCQGTPNVTIYGVSDTTCDIRVLEFA
jgi:hypothetical protein